MKSIMNMSISQIAVSGAIILLILYVAYHFIPGFIEGFNTYSKLTGIKAPLDRPLTLNNTQAMGSQQNSPGLNATGQADSAPNPLRDIAPITMATPYTNQPV
jgi:hypothetical protein